MKWTPLTFGKHAGKTLPQIIFKDADWFFWAIRIDVFKKGVAFQADDLYRKAQAIKIPKRRPSRWLVEYSYEDNGRFLGLRLVKAKEAGFQSPRNYRLPHLDLTYIRRRRTYDKQGCRNLLRDFRAYYFGKNKRVTKRRVEAFFNDDTISLNDVTTKKRRNETDGRIRSQKALFLASQACFRGLFCHMRHL